MTTHGGLQVSSEGALRPKHRELRPRPPEVMPLRYCCFTQLQLTCSYPPAPPASCGLLATRATLQGASEHPRSSSGVVLGGLYVNYSLFLQETDAISASWGLHSHARGKCIPVPWEASGQGHHMFPFCAPGPKEWVSTHLDQRTH